MNPTTRLTPGDGTLTKRILKRCRDNDISYQTETQCVPIGGGRYGRQTEAYIVPRNFYDEEIARREAELAEKERINEVQKKQRQLQILQKRIADLRERFPRLADRTIENLVESGKHILAPDKTGYQHGWGTKTYWKNLGFKVRGTPSGILVRGKRLLSLFDSGTLVPIKSRTTVAELRSFWLRKYCSEELMLAHAIRFANRLQKVSRHSSFYPLKDKWISANQGHLVDGRIARFENKSCWGCNGTGTKRWGDECWKCDGSGTYSSRTLYEHTFDIANQSFVFHSYVRPSQLSDERAADLKVYGRPFAAHELPCPSQPVIIGLIEELLE